MRHFKAVLWAGAGLLIGGASLRGQAFVVAPSVIPNVEIVGLDSATFSDLLSEAAARAEDRAFIQPALPYSVAIRNTGSRPVAMTVVRYSYFLRGTEQNGILRTSYARTPFSAGASEIYTPSGAFRAMVNSPEKFGQTSRSLIQRLNLIRQSPTIAVQLDAVIFDNGEIAGPDESRTFEYLRRQREFRLSLLQNISRIQMEPQETILAELDAWSKAVGALPQSTKMDAEYRSEAFILIDSIRGSVRKGPQPLKERLQSLSAAPSVPEVWLAREIGIR